MLQCCMCFPATQPHYALLRQDIVLSRQNSFLSLIEQTPNILLVSFVGELGIELTHAWLYVIVDYLRRQKLDQICEFLESDQEALSRSIESMMQMTRKRVQTTALGGSMPLFEERKAQLVSNLKWNHGLVTDFCADFCASLYTGDMATEFAGQKTVSGELPQNDGNVRASERSKSQRDAPKVQT
eukprot:Skav201994  [mRNA]  locus=scaffold269:175799:180814:+ [translate_table: standard]